MREPDVTVPCCGVLERAVLAVPLEFVDVAMNQLDCPESSSTSTTAVIVFHPR
ncbi:MAG: hypothetical protein WB801_11385 [Candidatus Dormiibacterota bacterium]